MKNNEYASMRVLVAVDDAATGRVLFDAFEGAGIQRPAQAESEATLRQALETGIDLIVMTHELKGVFVAPLIAEVRRGLLGPQPFPIVVVLVPASDRTMVRKVSDCGPDDVVAMPLAPAALLKRIGAFVAGARQPLVVTKGYAGPERRTGGRGGVTRSSPPPANP